MPIFKQRVVAGFQHRVSTGVRHSVSPGVLHSVSPAVRTAVLEDSFSDAIGTVSSLRDEMELQQSFGFPNDQSADGTIAVCHAKSVSKDKHWYPLLLATATARSGLPLPDLLTMSLFPHVRRLLPVVALKLPMRHDHPQIPAESGGIHDS